jgi:hypothetical protein
MPLTLSPGLSLPSRRTPEALLARTRTFRDRVKNKSGSLEDDCLEGLYDPILRTVKDWGRLSDLLLLVSLSAVEVNNGSIPTLFDASGNEYDAIQTTTADQATLNKNGVGGRWAADFDGSGDHYDLLTRDFSQPYDVISVLVGTQTGDYESWLDATDRTPLVRNNNSDEREMYAGSILTGSPTTSSAELITNRFDGQNSIMRVDESQDVTGDAGTGSVSGDDLAIGHNPSGNDFHYSGQGSFLLIFDGLLNDVAKIELIINDYYSIY